MANAYVRPDSLHAWSGSSLLIVTPRGECAADHQLSGYYFREARFLRTLRLTINGETPWLCEAAMTNPAELCFNFVHPEIKQPGGGGTGQSGDEYAVDEHGLPERSLDIRLSYRIDVAALDVQLLIGNRERRPLSVAVAWELDADYADIQEAQSGRREQEAPVHVTARDGQIELTYSHPTLRFTTVVHHDGRLRLDDGRVTASLTLQPQQTEALRLRIVPSTGASDMDASSMQARAEARARWRDAFTRIEVPANRVVERAIEGNVRDIASLPLLQGPPDEWLSLQAGMPLYPAFFGRDAVTAGWQAASLDRGEALDAALTKLGRLQTDRVDDWRDEQPGRVPYQVRSGPLAVLNLNPYAAYYADFATPLMFVISLANLWAWTGDRGCVARHWDTARRILDWARDFGDMDGDGYLEYLTRSPKGAKNQGWKDSGDAVVYDDGAPVPPPIATCELQGYWYAAQQLMALLSWVMDAKGDAAAHRASATALKERFNRDWWMDDERFIALALDPGKRQVRAVTSNVGHCLASGIIDRDRLPAVVQRMFEPDLFSGWGIRTLSDRHAFYNPISYHRGTVWAVEQATIVFGLRRYGFDREAFDLSRALFDLAELYPERRIPECVGGYARSERAVPGAYPRTNAPQLWNATAFPLIVQSMLGLAPIGSVRTLIVDPSLPEWMSDLTLHGLRVGDATVSLRFWRDRAGKSRWKVLDRRGTLRIVRQPAPESLTARWQERLGGFLESLWH